MHPSLHTTTNWTDSVWMMSDLTQSTWHKRVREELLSLHPKTHPSIPTPPLDTCPGDLNANLSCFRTISNIVTSVILSTYLLFHFMAVDNASKTCLGVCFMREGLTNVISFVHERSLTGIRAWHPWWCRSHLCEMVRTPLLG